MTALVYTENSYSCPYADIDRVSDVTLGDAWGSELNETEQCKGISLILCQTDKGKQLIRDTRIELKEIDLEKEISVNRQLSHPSIATKKRGIFFKYIDRGFSKGISKCMPKFYYKQKLKAVLVGLGVIKNGGIEYVIRYSQ